jgi:hypothetical protein
MDVLLLQSPFAKGFLSKILSKLIFSKIGYKPKLSVNTFDLSMDDKDAVVKLELHMASKDVEELLNKLI